MATNKQNPTEAQQNVGQTVSNVEQFLKTKGKTIGWCALIVVVAVAAFLGVSKLVLEPMKEEAQGQTFVAENYFMNADYEKALNGDGNALGFIDIIDQYGSKAGKAVYFYAGVSSLQLKNYADAIKYLQKYSSKDNIMYGRALSCLGDAYVGNEELESGLSYYKKAIKESGENIFTAQYLLKAGITAEELGKTEEALGYYNEIAIKYPQSVEAIDVNKYIYRLSK
ncbi:MAG: tetratricopeptide repeat protein [Bacteroidales bacterium]|nr:tetratricopeptide repeat protein [Bacteroidales bacterium]